MSDQKSQEKNKSYDLRNVQKGSKVSALIAGEQLKTAYPKSTKDKQIVLGTVDRVYLKKNGDISSIRMTPIGSNQQIKIEPTTNKVKELYKSQNFDTRELHFPLKGKEYHELKGNIQPLLFGNRTNLVVDIPNKNNPAEKYNAKFLLARNHNTGLPNLLEYKQKKELSISNKIGDKEITPEIKNKLLNGETILLEGVTIKNRKQDLYIQVDKEINSLAFLNKKAINIPTQLHGVSLSEKQKADLSKGKKVNIVGVESKDNKTKFDVNLKISPAIGRFKYEKTNEQKIEKKEELKERQEQKREITEKTRRTIRR